MKKFSFSLDRKLNFDEQILDKEKATLGRLMKQMDECLQKRKKLEEEMIQVQQARESRFRAGTTVFELQGTNIMLISGRRQLEDLKEEIGKITMEIEGQRQQVVAASQEVKKLEKLKDRQWEEHRNAEAKEERENISEHVSITFVRNSVSR